MDITDIKLHSEQQAFFDSLKSGENACLTGPAGTGKSLLLEYTKTNLGKRVSVCASTGIAALNIGGTTLHSWAGLGIGKDKARTIAARLVEQRGPAYNNIMSAKVLAIDEISMIDNKLLTLLEEVLRRVRKNSDPFGGVQVLFIGDFLQLPPVIKVEREKISHWEGDTPVYVPCSQDEIDAQKHGRFAFQSPVWAQARVKTTLLKTIHRQKDRAFAEMLNECRTGRLTPKSIATLESRLCVTDPNAEIKPVRLNPTNAAVDAINHQELARIPGDEKVFTAQDLGADWAVEKLEKDCIAPRILTLKVGAQVMLIKNLDINLGLVNGSLGKVVGWGNGSMGYPVVEFLNGEVVECDPEQWEHKNESKVYATRSQVPLRLAWSITIHKCQGMTLDKVEADIMNVFEDGQAYVALSRAKTLEGLYLTGLNVEKITADPEALEFYESGGVVSSFVERGTGQGAMNLGF